jgi:hypothetical protein
MLNRVMVQPGINESPNSACFGPPRPVQIGECCLVLLRWVAPLTWYVIERGHISCDAGSGSISDGSLFLTLPTRALTGQQIMASEG